MEFMFLVGLLVFMSSAAKLSPRSSKSTSKQVIVISVPGESDTQYFNKLQAIADFAIEMDSKTYGRDYLFIVHDNTAWKYFEDYRFINAILIEVAVGDSLDLWMRDFPPTMPNQQVEFIYRPDYLTVDQAQHDRGAYSRFADMIGLPPTRKSDLVLEGGNIVENGYDVAITTKRIYWDNQERTESEIVDALENIINRHVAVFPDPMGTTGHADGIVSFVEEDTLLISLFDDPDGPHFYNVMEKIARAKFPNIKPVPLPCYVVNSSSHGFKTSEGSYANALVTNNAIYIPFYSDRSANIRAYNVYHANTVKDVVPIPSAGPLAVFGGSVRCMTWQIDQNHPVAKALFDYVDNKKRK